MTQEPNTFLIDGKSSMRSLLKSEKGFSLVEMLVTVAIIGILTMIAVPAYQGFQARARQKEGLGQLTAYHAAAQATRAEFGVYPGNFVQTGYQPTGVLNYRFRVFDGPDINLTFNDDACIGTQNDCNCGGNCPTFKTWTELPVGNPDRLGIGCVVCYPCAGLGAIRTLPDSYVSGVSGWISLQSAREDVYYMDDQKVLEACQDGLR